MSADLLRKAAREMREKAKAARAGRWVVRPSGLTEDASLVVAEWENDLRRVATCAGSLPEGNTANAEHIASWHPAVALAVADLLDHAADAIGNFENGEVDWLVAEELVVARAYLGTDA